MSKTSVWRHRLLLCRRSRTCRPCRSCRLCCWGRKSSVPVPSAGRKSTRAMRAGHRLWLAAVGGRSGAEGRALVGPLSWGLACWTVNQVRQSRCIIVILTYVAAWLQHRVSTLYRLAAFMVGIPAAVVGEHAVHRRSGAWPRGRIDILLYPSRRCVLRGTPARERCAAGLQTLKQLGPMCTRCAVVHWCRTRTRVQHALNVQTWRVQFGARTVGR